MNHNSQHKTMQLIAKGGAITIIASIFSYGFGFLFKLLISRFLGPSEFGLFTLASMIAGFSLIISLLGVHIAVGKFVPFFLENKKFSLLKGTLISSFQIASLLGVILGSTIFIFSGYIADSIFHEPGLKIILQIFALMIPFYALTTLINNIFFAFKKPSYTLITGTFITKFITLISTAIIIFLGGRIFHVSIAYCISFFIAALIGMIIIEKKLFSITCKNIISKLNHKQLLSFSFPLVLAGISLTAISWTDTFFVGFFENSAQVGIYTIAFSLAATLKIFFASIGQMFYPTMSGVHAKGDYSELAKNYQNTMHWMIMLTIPFSILFLIIPSHILGIIYGSEYLAASIPLIILTFGYTFHATLGPATHILKVFSKTKTIFWINIFAVVINIIFNIILIPLFSIVGAAIATTSTIFIRKSILFIMARREIPFSMNYKKIIHYLLALIIPVAILLITINLFRLRFISLILLISVYLFVYLVTIFFTKALDHSDHLIINGLIKKIGLSENKFIKKYIIK